MISIKMNLKTFESRYSKMYMPGIINLAEQYTNSVFNSKIFVELLLIKYRIYLIFIIRIQLKKMK
jgi:hypothetical protein